MSPSIRHLIAVLLSALITWLILNQSYMFRISWWGFVLVIGFSYMVIDYAIQLIYQKITGRSS